VVGTVITATTAVKFQHALIQALTFSTHHSSLAVSPCCFFSFQQRPSSTTPAALKRSIRGLAHWPLCNDFGIATWFRTEHAKQMVHLLSVRTDQDAGWTISLVPLVDSGAYCLVVSVYDSDRRATPAHQLTVSACVLVPRNWYHVAVEDADEIVFSSDTIGATSYAESKRFSMRSSLNNSQPVLVVDFEDPDHNDAEQTGTQQDLSAIGSKVFIVWNPNRSMDTSAFELHVGAHVQQHKHPGCHC
jgi:hypothetical protein